MDRLPVVQLARDLGDIEEAQHPIFVHSKRQTKDPLPAPQLTRPTVRRESNNAWRYGAIFVVLALTFALARSMQPVR